jgi:hypothetical protein
VKLPNFASAQRLKQMLHGVAREVITCKTESWWHTTSSQSFCQHFFARLGELLRIHQHADIWGFSDNFSRQSMVDCV